MNRNKSLQLITSLVMIVHFLAGCGTPTVTLQSTSISLTPTIVPPTPTSVPPTSTTIPATLTIAPPTPTTEEKNYSFKEVRTIQVTGEGAASVALNADGRILAYGTYGDTLVHLVDATTGTEISTLKGHTSTVTSLAFNSQGNLLASAGTVNSSPEKDAAVRIWDIKTGKQLASFESPGIASLLFSPDGAVLAGSGTGQPAQVILWDVTLLQEKNILEGVFRHLAFSPDSKLIAVGARDNSVHIFDVAAGTEVQALTGHTDWVSATAFSPDGKLLASGSDDTSIRIWSTRTNKELKLLTGHSTQVGFLTFYPDARVLVSLGSGLKIKRVGDQIQMQFGSEDRFVRFWDIETGKQIGSLKTTEGVSSISLNSDATLIAVGGKDVRLWSSR